jgi:hypothetical protein
MTQALYAHMNNKRKKKKKKKKKKKNHIFLIHSSVMGILAVSIA